MRYARPNLFRYATKELWQDAVICWLIDRAGSRRPSVRERVPVTAREGVSGGIVRGLGGLAPANWARTSPRRFALAFENKRDVGV